jgi:hypothetical protein
MLALVPANPTRHCQRATPTGMSIGAKKTSHATPTTPSPMIALNGHAKELRRRAYATIASMARSAAMITLIIPPPERTGDDERHISALWYPFGTDSPNLR